MGKVLDRMLAEYIVERIIFEREGSGCIYSNDVAGGWRNIAIDELRNSIVAASNMKTISGVALKISVDGIFVDSGEASL